MPTEIRIPPEGPLRSRLAEIRAARKMTTRQVAEQTAISFWRISGFQLGELVPTQAEVNALCAALDCHPRDLYADAERLALRAMERHAAAARPELAAAV